MRCKTRLGEKHSTSGFTFVELIVATSLAGVIIAAAAPIASNILTSTQRNREHMAVLTDYQNLGFWLSHDAQMAQSTSLIDNGPSSPFLSIAWVDQYEGVYASHYAIYSLSNNEISRNYDGLYLTVARRAATMSFSSVDGRIEATIYSIPYYGYPGGQRRDYVFSPRP